MTKMENIDNESRVEVFTPKNALDYLQLSLRYIMSGFITIVISVYLLDNKIKDSLIIDSDSNNNLILLLAFSGLIGILTYTLHVSFIDKVMYRVSVLVYLIFHKVYIELEIDDLEKKGYSTVSEKKNSWYQKIVNPLKVNTIIFNLVSQTYLRRTSDASKVRLLQKELENKIALLMFMYGVCYSCFLFPFLITSLKLNCNCFCCSALFNTKLNIIHIVGYFVLTLTFFFDFRITRRELWLSLKYYQK